jgi:hypothetical protein
VTDLLERPVEDGAHPPVAIDGGSVQLQLRPFQVLTLRFAAAGQP